MTVYESLQKERDNSLSYLRFDSTPYSGTELEQIYTKAYYDGLDVEPGRSFRLDGLTGDRRKAYIHGYFTGDYESLHADD